MKSHFKFSKGQRNGIFLLLLIIISLQSIYLFVNVTPKDVQVNDVSLLAFQKEIDSLKQIQLKQQPKLYPFNPNYITDYKGYTLGMSTNEIDRLLAYRNSGKWINSTKQFQEVTQISDSLLKAISPYFKFPDWVVSQQKEYSKTFTKRIKTFNEKTDLNTATAQQLQSVNGVGKILSERIIKFRDSFKGGFIADIQLLDVYGLSPEVIQRITQEFTVKTPRDVKKISLNSATVEELVTIQHIDYELAYEIIEQRTLKEGYKSLDELTKVKDFPIPKIEIIKLYLKLN